MNNGVWYEQKTYFIVLVTLRHTYMYDVAYTSYIYVWRRVTKTIK